MVGKRLLSAGAEIYRRIRHRMPSLRIPLRWSLGEFLGRLFALCAPAWLRTIGGYRAVPPSAGLRSILSIADSQLNFKIINLSPLSFRSLAVRYSKKLLQAIMGGNRLRRIHSGIIPSLDKGGRARPAYGQ
jgi:hypothetical protein